MTLAVVTDSAAFLPPALAAERGIGVVELHAIEGDDGATTARPSVAELAEAYETALSGADEVLALHLTAVLSGTIDNARLAAARFDGRVRVLDLGVSAGALGLAALAAPAETWQFFTWAMWDPGRAGFADYSGNQNLKGAIARALPESSWNPVWAACSLLTVLAAWFLCRRLDRLRGTGDTADDAGEAGLVLALQVSVVMVLGLLISPISWSHHWVWCLPALMSVGAATWRWRSIALGVAGVAGVLVFFLAMQWWFPEQNHVEQNWPAWAKVVGSSYTWWALGCGLALWWASGRRLAALRR